MSKKNSKQKSHSRKVVQHNLKDGVKARLCAFVKKLLTYGTTIIKDAIDYVFDRVWKPVIDYLHKTIWPILKDKSKQLIDVTVSTCKLLKKYIHNAYDLYPYRVLCIMIYAIGIVALIVLACCKAFSFDKWNSSPINSFAGVINSLAVASNTIIANHSDNKRHGVSLTMVGSRRAMSGVLRVLILVFIVLSVFLAAFDFRLLLFLVWIANVFAVSLLFAVTFEIQYGETDDESIYRYFSLNLSKSARKGNYVERIEKWKVRLTEQNIRKLCSPNSDTPIDTIEEIVFTASVIYGVNYNPAAIKMCPAETQVCRVISTQAALVSMVFPLLPTDCNQTMDALSRVVDKIDRYITSDDAMRINRLSLNVGMANYILKMGTVPDEWIEQFGTFLSRQQLRPQKAAQESAPKGRLTVEDIKNIMRWLLQSVINRGPISPVQHTLMRKFDIKQDQLYLPIIQEEVKQIIEIYKANK